MPRIKSDSLSFRTKNMILEMINNNEFENNKLPSEDRLAKELGVSLSTLREALVVLKNVGIIEKKHGSGSYVHKSALDAKMRIDLNNNFRDLLEESGYDSSLVHLKDETLKTPDLEKIGLKTNLDEDEEILSYERMFYADNIPAIWAKNNMPRRFLKAKPEGNDFKKAITQFIWEFNKKELAQSIIEYVPFISGDREKRLFDISPGKPLISWNEVFYDIKDNPISFNKIIFNSKIINLKMLRKY